MNAPDAKSGGAPKRRLDLSIGCVPLRLRTSDMQLFRAASSRYSAFAAAAAQPIRITLNESSRSESEPAEFGFEFEGAALHASSRETRFDGVRNEYALDSLLRVLLSWKLAGRHGFLLHAATVVRDGKAYVFTGRSGAGKSTVASLSPKQCRDEISLPRFEKASGAYGTPFWGEFRAAGSIPRLIRGPLRLVGRRNRATPLRAPLEMLRTLLPNALFLPDLGQSSASWILSHALISSPSTSWRSAKIPRSGRYFPNEQQPLRLVAEKSGAGLERD